jgi:hypothetical protein
MAGDAHRIYEIRCPVYGFVKLNDWEWQIISQHAFQRLRRIRQLGWTDYVFPGAVHTRLEHSLGVMHMSTMLYEESRNDPGKSLSPSLATMKTAWGATRPWFVLWHCCMTLATARSRTPPRSCSLSAMKRRATGTSTNNIQRRSFVVTLPT